MTDLQWTRVLELYDSVGNLPLEAARALLDSSAEDPAVLHEVTAMLGSLQQVERDSSGDSLESNEPETSQARYTGISIGRYEVLALIGRGSTGDVYSGRDRELARPVALKFVSTGYASEETATEQFIREARAISALNHPNI